MKKINKHVEVIRTRTRRLSSMSDGPSKLILSALRAKYAQTGITYVSTLEDLQPLILLRPDLCFLGLKQLPVSVTDPTLVWVSDYLEEQGINYTGSDSSAMALEYNKQAAKAVVIAAGLETTRFFVGATIQDLENSKLSFPLFIKPTNLGNKNGIDSDSVVHDAEAYLDKVHSLKSLLFSESLIEEYLTGREFSVSVLRMPDSDELLTLPIEAVIQKNDRGDRILGATNESAEAEQVVAVDDEKIYNAICDLAKNVFIALGARDYGRIDIRLDEHGVANFLEANLVPGLSAASYFPIANMLNRTIDYDATIQSIAELAFERKMSTIAPEVALIAS